MRTVMMISLILLSVMIHEAQGIRFRNKGTPPDRQHGINKILQGNKGDDGVEEAILCKRKHCSGRIRRLTMTPIIPRSTTIPKNDEKVENRAQYPKSNGSLHNVKLSSKDEDLSVSSSSVKKVDEQRQPGPETYPGILDIAGMDYSQARRKPPIHNK